MIRAAPSLDVSIAVVSAVLVVFTACASDPIPLYPGPPLPRDRVAVLEESYRADVFAVDGVRTSGEAWSLMPGWHEVWLKERLVVTGPNVGLKGGRYCLLRFEALAGGAYRAVTQVREELAWKEGADKKVTIYTKILDAEGEVQATPEGCSARRPDLED